MNLLQATIDQIKAPDQTAIATVKQQLGNWLKVPGSLGYLEELLLDYVGITGQSVPNIPKKCTVIACADHGVAAMKISAYPIETTVQMTKNYLLSQGAVANALANFSASQMIVVDMGIAAPMDKIPGLINRKIALGTQNCAHTAAMTPAQALQSLHTGIEIANTYSKQGVRCFLPGEMGIANTTASAAIVATLCKLTPEQATGRGTNISDARLKIKIEVVRQALAVNSPDPTDGLDVLAKVGGFELGCIAGIILGAAANRAFVVLDGFNTGAAALIASSICPRVKKYLMGSHLAAEPAHQQILELLGIHPYMDMQFRLGEATGSSIAVNLLDAVIRAYQHICTDNKQLPHKQFATFSTTALTTKALDDCIRTIPLLNKAAMDKCQLYIDNLTKPIHSLGALEALAVKIAGITNCSKPPHQQKALLAFNEETSAITAAFAVHANAVIAYTTGLSTANPTPSLMLQAIAAGIAAAQLQINQGRQLIGFCSATPQTQAAANDIWQHIDQASAWDLLINNGTAELCAMVGAIIGTANARGASLPDAFPSQLAAYLACQIAPRVKDYIIITEYAPNPTYQTLAARLGLPAYLALNMQIGQGCTSALGMKLIDAAMHMVNDMKTFAATAVAVADDGPGANRQQKIV